MICHNHCRYCSLKRQTKPSVEKSPSLLSMQADGAVEPRQSYFVQCYII